MIELKHIEKVYEDGFQALKDINLCFEEGKINVLIGPSGCGKTTTMKLLNRLEDYTSGEILLDGRNIQHINPITLRRKMGFVIQNIGLFPHMNIYNNVATVPKLLKWDKTVIQKRVVELLEMVDLDPKTYMKRHPSELSGGQQQRIGVIRALAAEPSTILMDEPFSALDPISREQLQNELIRLQRDINKTIIFVTHDMDEAIKIADQIILMKDGHIVQQATPEEMLTHPANDFVREFIGEKRLDNNKKLLTVEELLSAKFMSISIHMSVTTIMEKMIANRLEEVPIVDANEKYVGMLHLYDLLAHKDVTIQELMQQAPITIHIDDDTQQMLSKWNNIQGVIPVLKSDGTLAGVMDAYKLIETLKEFTDTKCGVA